MTVGYPVDKRDVDSKAGQLAVQLRDTFEKIRIFKERLDSVTDPQMTALGYTAGDINTIRTAYTDLAQLRDIYLGDAALGSVKDFEASARPLTGVV
jgi:hypothetical protein